MDPLLKMIAVVCFAALFGVAGVHKLRNRTVFQDQLAAYGLVPDALLGVMARTLPILELALATALFIPALTIMALWGSALLLALYGLVMALALVQGRANIDCGCSGANGATSVSTALVVRNALLAALAIGATLPGPDNTLSLPDRGLGVLMATGLCILYMAASQLMANGPNLKVFRNA